MCVYVCDFELATYTHICMILLISAFIGEYVIWKQWRLMLARLFGVGLWPRIVFAQFASAKVI